jgi:hypothetical protein
MTGMEIEILNETDHIPHAHCSGINWIKRKRRSRMREEEEFTGTDSLNQTTLHKESLNQSTLQKGSLNYIIHHLDQTTHQSITVMKKITVILVEVTLLIHL